MAWDWIEKGAKRLQEIGGEYKQHQALVERLLTLDPTAAQIEVSQLWPAMDDRARAGVKMTLAGLTLSHQAAAASVEAAQRTERLKALHAAIEQAARGTTSSARGSTEASVTAGAARVTQTIANAAERARPKAEEFIESARQGIEKHGPAVEAAVKTAINELLKAQVPGAAPRTPQPPNPAASAAPPPADATPPRDDTPQQPSTAIAGHWVGTLRRAGTTDTLGCDLHLAASGRPLWSYHDSNGFHQTELTHEGQTIQYVPPERGVVTVKVQSVTGSSTQTGYVVDYSFERSSNGYMTQRYQRIALNGWLRGGQLQVTYSEDGISSFGDKTGLTAGSNLKEYSGSLIKQG
jgi:hypothetical protein